MASRAFRCPLTTDVVLNYVGDVILFAKVFSPQNFPINGLWRNKLEYHVNASEADTHARTQTYRRRGQNQFQETRRAPGLKYNSNQYNMFGAKCGAIWNTRITF